MKQVITYYLLLCILFCHKMVAQNALDSIPSVLKTTWSQYEMKKQLNDLEGTEAQQLAFINKYIESAFSRLHSIVPDSLQDDMYIYAYLKFNNEYISFQHESDCSMISYGDIPEDILDSFNRVWACRKSAYWDKVYQGRRPEYAYGVPFYEPKHNMVIKVVLF